MCYGHNHSYDFLMKYYVSSWFSVTQHMLVVCTIAAWSVECYCMYTVQDLLCHALLLGTLPRTRIALQVML